MTSYGKWASLVGAALALALLATAGLFLHWKAGRLAALEEGGTLALTQQGVMEFADRGDGPVVVMIHGSAGGYDQGLVYGEALRRRGFRIVSVSRPGYLRTPLQTGVTPEEQADAIDSLLSTLGIGDYAVAGMTEGTPCALQLALRHPERVTATVLLAPLSSPLGGNPIASLGYHIFHDLTGDLGCWHFSLLLKAEPGAACETIIGIGSSLKLSRCRTLAAEALADPAQRAFLTGLFGSITPLSVREDGIINDNAQLKDPPVIAAGSITSPMLMVCGDQDTLSPLKRTRELLSRIPGSGLILLDRIGTVLPVGRESEEIWDEIAAFLRDPASRRNLHNG